MLARSLTFRAARRSSRLTEFDGDLSGAGVAPLTPRLADPAPDMGGVPACVFRAVPPRRAGVEEPGDEVAITPIDRGNAFYDVLDRFHREVIAGQLRQPDAHGWSEYHRTRATAVFHETADRFEHSGRTGRAGLGDR